jgi:hypothetical protein
MAEVLRHENGLIVKRPEKLTAEKTINGFAMTTTESVRSPLTIYIGVLPNGQQPDISQSWFGLFGYRYRVTEIEGGSIGSGGAEYKFAAMQALQNCWLVLSATQQAEYGEPSFLEAWAVLDNASASANPLKC